MLDTGLTKTGRDSRALARAGRAWRDPPDRDPGFTARASMPREQVNQRRRLREAISGVGCEIEGVYVRPFATWTGALTRKPPRMILKRLHSWLSVEIRSRRRSTVWLPALRSWSEALDAGTASTAVISTRWCRMSESASGGRWRNVRRFPMRQLRMSTVRLCRPRWT